MNRCVLLEPRIVKLNTRTGVNVERLLPHKVIRKIGAWCFVDHLRPIQHNEPMVVAAHPHTGLQTVSWPISGQIEHRDSIGSNQNILPGQLNLMTAGSGIAHSELSIGPESVPMHMVQLWIALPAESRNIAPGFAHHADLPKFINDGYSVELLVGEFMGEVAPTKVYSPLMAAQIESQGEARATFTANPEFEHGILVLTGSASVNGVSIEAGQLLYLETGIAKFDISSEPETKLLIIGGEPMAEKLLMWWNFIARDQSEIEQMRLEWNNGHERHPHFEDRIGGRILAPDLPSVAMRAR